MTNKRDTRHIEETQYTLTIYKGAGNVFDIMASFDLPTAPIIPESGSFFRVFLADEYDEGNVDHVEYVYNTYKEQPDILHVMIKVYIV